MTGDLGDSLDLPFEEQAATPADGMLNDAILAGGLVVMAMTVDVPNVGKKPAIAFRFAAPDGRFYQPVVYVADDDQMAKMRPLILSAVAAARRAAS